MKYNCKIYLLLTSIILTQIGFAQCGLTLVTNSTSPTCIGCTNGSVSVNVTGGTAPYTYVWTNNISAGTNNIFPLKDNTIFEENMGFSNGAGEFFVAGTTAAGFKNRGLLAFDIAGNIPAGASVTNANLRLYLFLTSGQNGPNAHALHRFNQNWGEGTSNAGSNPGRGTSATTNDATWLKNFFPGSDWTNAGGTFNTVSSASTIVNEAGFYNWSSATMVADIQSWLNNPAINYGWLLKSTESGNRQAKRYVAKEHATQVERPLLTVTYGPTIIGNTSSVSNLAPGIYNVTITDANACTSTASVTLSPFIAEVLPVPTTYRGAFDPAQPQWTNNWTNWEPQNTFYGATTINKSGIIGTETWTKNNVYRLDGPVYVDSLAILTIEPGTVIRGNDLIANSSLIVTRGAQIIANGTPCNPIVFTSNKTSGRAAGDWGGIIILGRGIHNAGTQNLMEGLSGANPDNYHGGTIANDNSGSLRYVRIEFGGFVFATNNEINGVTMGSVGSGTTIDHIQVSFTNDDAFEWFGGSVNCNYLVAYRNLDDDFDTDNGYNGTVQFGLAVKDPAIADALSGSNGFESDNNAGGTTAAPKTKAKFYNITQIGGFRCSGNGGPVVQPGNGSFLTGAHLRRNTEIRVHNSIFIGNFRGLLVDAVTLATNLLEFKNNIIAMDFTTSFVSPYAGVALAGADAPTTSFLNATANTNTILTTPCDVLVNAWSFTNPDYRPNATGSGASISGCDLFPFIEIDGVAFVANEAKDFLADVLENNIGSSNGTITVTIPKLSGWNITVPGLTLSGTFQSGTNGTSNVNGGTPNTNGNWNFRDDGSNIIAVSKAGYVIPQGGFVQIGFTATRKASTPAGTNQNLAENVSGGSDNALANNGAITTFSAN